MLVVSPIDSNSERVLATRPLGQRFSPVSLAWSPDGSKISVGVQSVGGNYWNVVAVSTANGETEQLTDGAWTSIRGTVWKPEQDAVIVQADEQYAGISNWQLFEVPFPNGAVRRLITDLNSYNQSLSISADGTKLLSVQGQSVGNIWVAPADDLAAAKQLTKGSIGELNGWWGISWTPDGKIVYVKVFDKTRAIWKMDADGSNQKPLIPGAGDNFYPSITADGRFVIFESTRNGRNEVWRANGDGSEMRRVTGAEDARQPTVSPDGKWIIYTTGAEHARQLHRISIYGGEAVRITSNEASWAQVSPDSQFIACLYKTENGSKLAILPIEGGEPVKLFDIPPRANFRLGVKWFPDGKAVAYRDWNEGIWVQKLSTAAPEPMPNLPNEKFYAFDWSRDGKFFAVTRGSEIRDVVLISNLK